MQIFSNQADAVNQLQFLSKVDRHSILIEGPSGCGKTYIARHYAAEIGVQSVQTIAPKVSEIREAIESSLEIDAPVLLIIENLDLGVANASHTLLKILEEPRRHMYLIITCSNIRNVPDTILSRSAVVSVSPPTSRDLLTYAAQYDNASYERCKTHLLWKCARSFHDVETILKMNSSQFTYFDSLIAFSDFNNTVSNIAWKLGHYEDNTEAPVELVIRYIIETVNTPYIRRIGVDCLNDLSLKRIASHAVLAKFAFEGKYCE